MASKIIRRIAAQGLPGLLPFLAEELSPSDLQSLLLTVFAQRAEGLSEPALLEQASRTPLLASSTLDARLLNAFDYAAYQSAPGFEALDLPPVAPLGTAARLGGIHQNSLLTTIRNAEVPGDSTPLLALECARRRRNQQSRQSTVRLCASQRVVRLQPFNVPGFTPHFRLFALVTAGRDTGSSAFEIQHLSEHIRFYLELFRALGGQGFTFQDPLVELSDGATTEGLLARAGVSRDDLRASIRAHRPGGSEQFLKQRGIHLPADVTDPAVELPDAERLSVLALLKKRVLDPLRTEFPEARFRFNFARLEGLVYYSGVSLRISPAASDGVHYPIIDGGLTDWTARLLQDRKERLLTSAIGSEFTCRRFLAAG